MGDNPTPTLLGDNNAQETGESRGYTNYTTRTQPVLRGPTRKHAVKFLKDRQRYAMEIAEKQITDPSLALNSWTSSIDRTLLKNFLFAGEFSAIAPGVTSISYLTENHIETFIKETAYGEDDAENPAVIAQALKDVKFPSTEPNAGDRIKTYYQDFFTCLENSGYGSFPEDNPKKTVKLLIQKLQPASLKTAMYNWVEYKRSLYKSIPEFLIVLKKEAYNHAVPGTSDSVHTRTRRNGAESTRGRAGRGRGTDTRTTTQADLRYYQCASFPSIKRRVSATISEIARHAPKIPKRNYSKLIAPRRRKQLKQLPSHR